MYKLLKEAGLHSNIILMNTATNTTLTVGNARHIMGTELYYTLYSAPKIKGTDITMAWDLTITETLAKEIIKLISPIIKPKNKNNKINSNDTKPKEKKIIDIFNSLYEQ